jgi:alkylation response protein AidB-like acyl-CoA dehydrogenase
MLDYADGADITGLRTRLRNLIDEQVPPDFLGAFTDDPRDLEIAQKFCRTLAGEGLLAMAWPVEYGGLDSSIWAQTALREEMWARHEPRGAQYMGINWVGPVLFAHGTDDQRARHLPPISSGEVIWCQGFSEPDAGSDLPALRTSARRIEGGWRINGQKIWTSYAQMADWCLLLARDANSDAPGRESIGVFLLPMRQDGVLVRPIPSMVGPHHLNEVFFDEVYVPDADVLGLPGAGWPIVRDVLRFERIGIARYARCDRLLTWAADEMSERWDDLPGALRSRWLRAAINTRRARLMAYRVLALQEDDAVSPVDTAAYRVAVTQLDQQAADVLVDLVDWARPASLLSAGLERAVLDHVRYSRASPIASGSTEMQKETISRSVRR